MKKSIFIVALVCLQGACVMAQTKVQVMAEQVADLAASLKTLRDGYKTVDKGLKNMEELKGGTWGLHKDYLASLTQVSPAVRDNPKIPVILDGRGQIKTLFARELTWQQQQGMLRRDELAYLQRVAANLLAAYDRDLEELRLVIQPGTQMSDDERIKRIDRLYAAATDKISFTGSFVHKIRIYTLDRQRDNISDEVIRKLYGIQ